MLRVPSFQKWLPFVLVASPALAQSVQKPLAAAPHFTIHDAIWSEWRRAAPSLKVDALPEADRERYQLTLQRIGEPGMPKLLPPELEHPTIETWEAKAKEARTPQERFTALHFLNRLKSPKALTALDGLTPNDARTWPKHLYLDANIATARLQGGEVSKTLQGFLDALKAEGKVDPVRAQAARLRLAMGGKEKELLPLVPATPGSLLALMDAWNQAPWTQRINRQAALYLVSEDSNSSFQKSIQALGLMSERPEPLTKFQAQQFLIGLGGYENRVIEGFGPGTTVPFDFSPFHKKVLLTDPRPSIAARLELLDTKELPRIRSFITEGRQPLFLAPMLPGLRKLSPQDADLLRASLLTGPDPIARAAAIEDLPEAPVDLDALTQLTWKDKDLEPQQSLIESYSRWKLPKEKQIELLKPWLQHPDWACRYLAYQQLMKLDAATPWPAAPEPNSREKALLSEAERMATSGKPVRLRLTFSGKRQVTLRLDPTVAPINVANLARLARKGFFNGRRVPRVVPDFVVQMGSPYDTMDGGPGYSVRCEDSLVWYGPGSVGMALSGKDTGGSQFFITTNATPHLTGKYTRLGEVEDLDHALKILDDLELGAKIQRVDVVK